MSACKTNFLFALSFTVGKEAGLALVVAQTERQAVQILKNSGNYNGMPDKYVILQTRNIGLTASAEFGLLMESYVNAYEAYFAILDAANKLKGEKGDKGDPGSGGGGGGGGDVYLGEVVTEV